MPADVASRGYELGDELGRGGFAVVHACRHGGRDDLACKISLRGGADDRARFEREAHALAAIGPPAVPELVEAGVVADGRPFLIMERVRGTSLARELAEPGGRSLEWIARRALAILDALVLVHDASIQHRDLKPGNLFFDDGGRAVIVDFGIAAVPSSPSITRTGAAPGTVEYMAPEQLRGEEVGERADLYAFGAIAFELLTGEPPFRGSRTEIERGHLARRVPRVRDRRAVPDEVDDLVAACLSKDPNARPRSAVELRDRLARAFRAPVPEQGHVSARTSSTVAGIPVSVADRTTRSSSRRATPIALLYLRTPAPALAIREALRAHGGTIARILDDAVLCSFVPEAEHEPIASATAAADALVPELGDAAVLHLAPAHVRRRPGRTSTVRGDAITNPQQWLPAVIEPGIVWTPQMRAAQSAPARHLPLVGRDDVLAAIAASAAAGLDSGEPAMLTVIGAPGTGKTRLFEHAVARASRARVLSPDVAAGEAVSAQLLGAALGSAEPPPDARAFVCDMLGDDVGADVWQAVAVTLGWHTSEQVRGTTASLRLATLRAIVAAVERLTHAGPVAIIVDDAHRADDATLDALAYLGARGDDLPLWIAVFADSRLHRRRHAWGARAARHTSVALEPLSEAAARELAAALLSRVDHPPREALSRLASWSAGNPAELVQLVDGLERDGIIRTHEGSEVAYVALDQLAGMPPSAAARWRAERALARLPRDLGSMMHLVAVLGPRVSTRELAGVAELVAAATGEGGALLDAVVALAELAHHGLVREISDGCYEVASRTVHRALLHLMADDLRERLHGCALAYWSGREGEDDERLRKIAIHSAGAGRAEDAVVARRALARAAVACHRYVDAEVELTRALELLGGASAARATLLRRRGEVRRHLSHYEAALADLAAARSLAEDAGDTHELVRILVAECAVCDFAEKLDESVELIERAWRLAPPAMDPGLAATLYNWTGVVRHRQHRYEDAIRHLRAAISLGLAIGDHESIVGSKLILAGTLRNLGRFDEGLRELEGALARCEAAGDLFHLTIGLCNRINFWRVREDLARARDDLSRAMQIAREMGYDETEMYGRAELASVELMRGDLDNALAQARLAHELATRRFRDAPVAVPSFAYGQLLAMHGRFDDARRVLAQIHAKADAPTPSLRDAIRSIDLAVRDASDAEWDAFLAAARASLTPAERVEVLWLRGRCALARNQVERARSALEAAHLAADELGSAMAAAIARDVERAAQRSR